MVNTHSWCLCPSSNIPSWWGLKYCFYLYFTGGKTMVQRGWVIQGYFTVSINEWINGVQALVCLVLKPSWTETNSHRKQVYGSVQFSSVAQLHPTLCDPMDCSTPDFPVHHQLQELAQIHVHWVGDAIQPSYPLSSPSPSAFNLSQHQGLFQWVSSSHQVAKVLEFQLQHQSFQWIFRTDFL